jgi:flagellar protein FlgJ
MSDMALPSSYLDFNALAQLRGEAAHDPNKAARKTAEQFESYFLQQMMKEMRATVEKSDLVESNAMDTYQDMMDKEVAQQMVRRGGIGLANMLEKQMLQQQASAVSTQDALKLHPGNTGAEPLPLKPAAPALPVGKPQTTPALELRRDGGRT